MFLLPYFKPTIGLKTALTWILLAFLCVVSLTRLISTFCFYNHVKRPTSLRQAPTAPYWFPGIYHLPGLLLSPASGLQNLLSKYGTYAPFACRAGPLDIVIITKPAHIKSLFLASKQITAKAFHLTVWETVLGLPSKAMRIYAADATADATADKDAESINFAHLPLNRRYMSGEPLVELTELYLKGFRKNMANVSSKEWTEISDLWGFLRDQIPRTIIEVLMGEEIFQMFPDFVNQFWAFDDNLQEYSRRMVWHGLKTALAPYAARDRMLANIKAWLRHTQEDHPDTDAIEKGDGWDAKTGSRFMKHRDSIFAGILVMGLDGRASEALGLLQGANANIMPSTFWYILETLLDPHLNQKLKIETQQYYSPPAKSYDATQLCANPLLQSMNAEVTRLRMATAIIRKSEVDCTLANTYSIPKGTLVLAFPSDAALQTESWREARPQTVVKPLEQFWAERFLVPDSKSGESRFSMEGLNALHFTFGGGQNMCPGRAWAKNIQIATLAVLLTEYEVELVDRKEAKGLIPPLREIAFGTIKPRGKIAVRIRAKRGGQSGGTYLVK